MRTLTASERVPPCSNGAMGCIADRGSSRGQIRGRPRMAMLAVGTLLAAACTAVPPRAEATFPGRNGLMALDVAVSGGNSYSRVVDPAKRRTTRVRGLCSRDTKVCAFAAMRWAPGGGRLFLYAPPVRSGQYTPTLLRVGGRAQSLERLRPALLGAFGPAWSPDGRRFAFSRADGIYTIGLNGRGLRRILVVPDSRVREWSTRGRILFERDSGVFTVKSNGRDLHRIRLAGVENPSFSPDGRRIVYDKRIAYGRSPYYQMRIARWDGRFDHPIRPRPPGEDPVWSPDGKRIAYIANAYASSYNQRVFTIRADGGGRRLAYALPSDYGAVSIFDLDWQARKR